MRRVSDIYILIGIGIMTLGVLSVLYFTLTMPVRKKGYIVDRQYTSNSAKLRKYLSGIEGPPSKRIIQVLEEGNKRLEKEYELLKKRLPFEQSIQMPTSRNPVLFFQSNEWKCQFFQDSYFLQYFLWTFHMKTLMLRLKLRLLFLLLCSFFSFEIYYALN